MAGPVHPSAKRINAISLSDPERVAQGPISSHSENRLVRPGTLFSTSYGDRFWAGPCVIVSLPGRSPLFAPLLAPRALPRTYVRTFTVDSRVRNPVRRAGPASSLRETPVDRALPRPYVRTSTGATGPYRGSTYVRLPISTPAFDCSCRLGLLSGAVGPAVESAVPYAFEHVCHVVRWTGHDISSLCSSGTSLRRSAELEPGCLVTRSSVGGDRRVSYALSVPSACRLWARSRRLPLRDLLQQFVLLGAHLVESLPPGVRHVPSAVDLLAAASVPRDAELVLSGQSDAAAASSSRVVSNAGALPGGGGPAPAGDPAASLALRLRSYAMSCRAVHSDLDAPQLVYMVAAYAVALGVPAESAAASAEAAVVAPAALPLVSPVPAHGDAS